MSFLEMSGIVKSFGRIKALDGADFEAERGEIHGIAGANGSGKSTVAHILAGITAPDAGSVRLGGTALKTGDVVASQAGGIGIVYQESQAIAGMTVAQTIMLGREPRSMFGVINEHRVNEAAAVFLSKIDMTNLIPEAQVGSLPENDVKLVEIARAALLGERVAIFDEAEEGLNRPGREKLRGILRMLKDKGVTSILVSHGAEFLLSLCDRVTVLRNGRKFSTVEASAVESGELMMLIGEPAAKIPQIETSPGVSAREVPSLGLSLRGGEIAGADISDGQVKTDAIRALFGAEPRMIGDVSIFGFSMRMSPPGGAVRHRVGLSPEERKLRCSALYITVRKNTAYARVEHTPIRAGGDSPFAGMLGFGKRSDPMAETLAAASEIFEPSETYGGRSPADLIFKGVDTVIFDEPSRGADESAKSGIYALIAELAKRGMAILIFTTRKKELEDLCGRVAEIRGA
ncbi:MAG: ATP-binding cassette domain-containing protein [Synergistaceae bacterium]|jgi:ABC-type sugar transport system ATPase subunit|nr:ATP-binding cassette domain-containing protein [Synergistaceae bacterium]